MNFPRSCKCSSLVSSRYPLFLRKYKYIEINASPATKVLPNVYQLYMVEYHFASILMSHNQGMDDMTVNAKKTMYKAAQTVFVQVYFLPSSVFANGLSSILRESLLIFLPNNDHAAIVKIVQKVKKPLFKKPDLPSNTSSPFTNLESVQ